jgi:hypothetical protein
LIIDSSHRGWIAVTAVISVVATAGYFVYAANAPEGPSGGSIPGMLYGITGSLLMLFAGLLSARKQVPTWRLGRAQTWLKGHIWLGLLSVPLILFHSGFHWGGRLEQVLWIVFALIIASGIFGLVLQQVLPRFMTKQIAMETIYEQIPHVCTVMRADADTMVAAVCGPLGIEQSADSGEEKGKKKAKVAQPAEGSGPLKDFYLRDVRPFLDGGFDRSTILANETRASGLFSQVRVMVPPTLHETLDQLAAFCEERRQFAEQSRLHHWLHGWLFVHVPLSMALLVLGVAHAVMALWY